MNEGTNGAIRVSEWLGGVCFKEEVTASQQVDTEKKERKKAGGAYQMTKFLHFLSNTNDHFIK